VPRFSYRAMTTTTTCSRLTPTKRGDSTCLLADGEGWSSSALVLALGTSQRTVQRALDHPRADGKVRAIGRSRARRWMTPPLPGSRQPCYSRLSCPVGKVIASSNQQQHRIGT
jgi:hypothetical protein